MSVPENKTRSVVCACSAGTVGSFSNKRLSPIKPNDARTAEWTAKIEFRLKCAMLLRCCGAQSRRGPLLLPAARRASQQQQQQQQHRRGFLGSQLLKRLRRWQPSFRPAERPSRKRLWQELAESFDDGTPQGAETAAQFERLCAAVGRIISVEHSALSARLHEEYRQLDPSRPRLPSASQPEAEAEAEAEARADALCTALHGVLRSAGFDLTDVADEQHAKVGPP